MLQMPAAIEGLVQPARPLSPDMHTGSHIRDRSLRRDVLLRDISARVGLSAPDPASAVSRRETLRTVSRSRAGCNLYKPLLALLGVSADKINRRLSHSEGLDDIEHRGSLASTIL
jgi:hypothetical protein